MRIRILRLIKALFVGTLVYSVLTILFQRTERKAYVGLSDGSTFKSAETSEKEHEVRLYTFIEQW